jgi:hypothetical protein
VVTAIDGEMQVGTAPVPGLPDELRELVQTRA